MLSDTSTELIQVQNSQIAITINEDRNGKRTASHESWNVLIKFPYRGVILIPEVLLLHIILKPKV